MGIKEHILRGAATGLVMGAIVVFFGLSFLNGIEREAQRQEAHTQSMCKYYAQAMNNWALANNKERPCK